jgi:hypothetical protein
MGAAMFCGAGVAIEYLCGVPWPCACYDADTHVVCESIARLRDVCAAAGLWVYIFDARVRAAYASEPAGTDLCDSNGPHLYH